MESTKQVPPPERILRAIPTRMDTDTRVYIGRRIAELNTRARRLDAEKKAAAAHFKAVEKDIETESVSLESASPMPDGKEVEVIYPCEGRVNLTTGMFDIFVLERDSEGREMPRFVRSESLPEKYLYLLQEELPFDGKKDGKKGKDKKDKKKDGEQPPEFPEDK